MKRRDLMMFVLGLFILSSSNVFATIIIDENFDSLSSFPTTGWTLFSEDNNHYPYLTTATGNPTNSLAAGGGHHFQGAGTYYNTPIDYSLGGSLQLDSWIASAGWHYSDIQFGLGRMAPSIVPSGQSFEWIARFDFNKGSGANAARFRTLQPTGLYDNYNVTYTPEQWNTGKITINSDLSVSYYLNDILVHTAPLSIDSSYSGQIYFGIMGWQGNGPAFADNILVDMTTNPVPEPTTIFLFGTGIAGLISTRIRKKK